jgi:signal transduction histidine kinase
MLDRALTDTKRLRLLQATALLDSAPEEAFDRFTRLASGLMKTPVSLISLVDKDRQFFKSQHGLSEPLASARETPLTHSFCKHLVATAKPLVVPDAREHPLLRNNPAIHESQVIAYLGVPLRTPEGQTLGSLCTIDEKPRDWTEQDIKTLQDLATWVMTEIQLRLLARHFSKNYLEVRDLELQRTELTQMLVHDLRNPLNSLLIGLELLQGKMTLDKQGQQYVALARLSGETLMRMVTDILDVSKSEAGKMALDLARCLPENVIEKAYRQSELMAYSAGVTISKDIASDLPPIRIDEEKLRRVLVNLISNAVQHTPPTGKVRVCSYRSVQDNTLVLEVIDSGCGISKEHFGQIFEKFGSLSTRTGGRASTGLGLPFCKIAIEAHGGRISVESEIGRGTIFRVTIPYEPPVAVEEKKAA